MDVTQLERAARAAFARGDTWHYFWSDVGPAILAAEPDRRRRHRLVDHLLALVVSGDLDGDRAVGDDDEPGWERDDRLGDDQVVDDTATEATIQTTFPGIIGGSKP